MTMENKACTIMPVFSTISMMLLMIVSMVSPSFGCLYDRNWKEKNMTTRAHVADYVIAGRVDSVYLEEKYFVAEFHVFCVFKTNNEHAKFPMVINITVATAPNVFCAVAIPQFDLDQSYIVLLTGNNITSKNLYPMTVNAQRAEFNLTQANIDEMQEEFGAGKSTQGLSENDSMLKMCPNDLNEMIGEERVEEEMKDGYSTTPMARKTPSDLKEDEPKQTATPASDTQINDKGTGPFVWGSPLLIMVTFGIIFIVSD